MKERDEKLLRIEQSIINKIEHKGKKVSSKIEKRTDDFSNDLEKKFEKGFEAIGKHIERSLQKKNKSKRRPLTMEQEYALKKHKVTTDMRSHIAAFISVNLFLFAIYMLTSPFGFPWFLFPLLGWGIGLLTHLLTYKQDIKKIDILYANRGLDTTKDYTNPENLKMISSKTQNDLQMEESEMTKLDEPYLSYVRDSNELSTSLLVQIKDSKNVDKELTEQIKNSLVHYTEKIQYLAKRGQFLEQAIIYFEKNDPEQEKKNIQDTLNDDSVDDTTKKEYENAMRMLDKQQTSLDKLLKVKDTISARLKTSLITLKTLQLDFIRLQYITDESAEDAINSINQKTEEIDEYIDLLGDSLKDIDSQI